ncbi:uncharacterized protein TNCV_1009051 [Trichonephila clavipes]|nr:uncharacterized protein TNCV_1009051 [Trichonephila clavipes]
MIGTTFRDRKIQQTFPLEDAAWMFWQNQNGGKALIGSEVLQKTGRSKKFILTLKSLTLKKKDKKSDRSQKGKLEVAELYEAEKVILKEIQLETLAEEKQIKLNTMKGDDGLIRVETRVSCRKDLETFRYPILLPNTHQLVKKLIMEKHIELEHAGTQTLMSNLRESYWIIKSRKTIRQVVRSCITCKRFSARPLETVSIPLPEDRVRKEASVKDGDIVLIGDNDVKRINWPMAKIIKSFPGKDGRIRVVEVKTPSSNFIRPIQKLYPLEVNLPEASDFRERIQKDQKNQEISTSRRGRTLRPPKRLEL